MNRYVTWILAGLVVLLAVVLAGVLIFLKSQPVQPHGFIFASEEVIPGEGIENWIPFFKACKESDYQGYFGYEQCAPFLMA